MRKIVVLKTKTLFSLLMITQLMEILRLEEIPMHQVVKRWTRDARDILPDHLVWY